MVLGLVRSSYVLKSTLLWKGSGDLAGGRKDEFKKYSPVAVLWWKRGAPALNWVGEVMLVYRTVTGHQRISERQRAVYF